MSLAVLIEHFFVYEWGYLIEQWLRHGGNVS